ncbi:MAG: CoA-binding protein [Chloroflexi bacterium]|nr:CoA-binding protein [Chloroflexota bacterium]
MQPDKLEQYRPIFFPEAIAVLGVSGEEANAGARFYTSLLKAGFQGNVYAVNPRGGEIDGRPLYPSVSSIPHPVDTVIIAIPAMHVPTVLEECAKKGVKVAQIYTAGFSESGTEEGRRLEAVIVEKARQNGILIVGPNCMGVYSPARRLPYGMSNYAGEVGSIGFLSQSGGLGGMLMDMGVMRGLKFSKAVSFGNGTMLDSVDYLDYFAADPATTVVGAYLEGMRNGARFLESAIRVARKKPLVLWRGGRTEVGAKCAVSHTGSLAGPDALWSALAQQAGAVRVFSLEEVVDTLLAFQVLERDPGNRLAFVSGLTGGGGGIGVSASDAFCSRGLQLPAFSAETRERLTRLLPPAGTVTHNPLDVGGQTIPMESLFQCFLAVVQDPAVDFLVFHERTGFFMQPAYTARVEAVNDLLITLKQTQDKPVVVISPAGTAENERLSTGKKLIQAGIPVFSTLEGAAAALRNVNDYWAAKKNPEARIQNSE